jgi:hypothetical protein
VPHPETGEPLAVDGTPARPARTRTPVERRGRLVAWLDHDSSVAAITEIADPAALALEREALRASARLQEQEIRASTARLVEAGAERRRLERDLHDGAQQRLLALALALERTPGTTEAQASIGAMRDELRRLAHGIHSVTLVEGGLREAVLALVEAADGRVAVEALPSARTSAATEAAIYRLVAVTLRVADGATYRLSRAAECERPVAQGDSVVQRADLGRWDTVALHQDRIRALLEIHGRGASLSRLGPLTRRTARAVRGAPLNRVGLRHKGRVPQQLLGPRESERRGHSIGPPLRPRRRAATRRATRSSSAPTSPRRTGSSRTPQRKT